MSNYLKVGKYIIEYNLKIDTDYFDIPWKLDAFSYKGSNYNTDFYYKTCEFISLDEIFKTCKKSLYKEYMGFYNYEIYINNDNSYTYIFKLTRDEKPILAYNISSDWKCWNLIYDITNTNGKYAFEHFTRLFSYSVINYGAIVLHGALIEYDNKGIIICAPSGTGKTTHARLWRDSQNALIINGHRPLCINENNNWYGYGTPWCGTSGEYINRKVAINAIVILEQSSINKLTKLNLMDSFGKMLVNLTAPIWNEDLMHKAVDYLNDMVCNIPVYKLECRPDLDAVHVLKTEIDKI